MDSFLKQTSASSTQESPGTYLEQFLSALTSMTNPSDVERIYKKLQYLGVNFDPFAGNGSDECRQVIKDLGLTGEFANPYQATNLLLRLLDMTEERLNLLKQ
jgi:hypothetical protein